MTQLKCKHCGNEWGHTDKDREQVFESIDAHLFIQHDLHRRKNQHLDKFVAEHTEVVK